GLRDVHAHRVPARRRAVLGSGELHRSLRPRPRRPALRLRERGVRLEHHRHLGERARRSLQRRVRARGVCPARAADHLARRRPEGILSTPASMAPRLRRAATDVGGTFTDLAWYDVDPKTGECSEVRTANVDTTPPDFDRGVLGTLDKAGVIPASLAFFAHGSTVVINALTERKGVKTGLITTRGFRDVLE